MPDWPRSTLPSSSEVISGTIRPTAAPSATSGTTIASVGGPAVHAQQRRGTASAPRIEPKSITRRAVKRRAMRAAKTLAAMTTAVIGAKARPVSSAFLPCTRWKYRLRTKISP